jgi:hypothetical protein
MIVFKKNVMRPLFIFTFGILFFTACQNKTEPSSLDKALIRSFKDKNIEVLKKYFPTKSVYKLLGKELPKRSDEEIDSFLSNNDRRLIEGWNKMIEIIEAKKIDPGKINIKESIVYDPFRESSLRAMVIVYEYDNKTWDDLSLIIHKNGDSTYLLEIPNPTKAFSFSDTSLAESSLAKNIIEIKKPEFQQSVEKHVTQLINWAKNGNIKEFAGFVVYRGEDKNRSWKSAINMQDDEENKQAINIMEKVQRVIKDCNNFSFGKIHAERESEGYWIVQPVICGDKTVSIAFLKINDKLLMGDIDVETQEQ